MQTVLVANLKGGCGKTTIATHLAAACAAGGLRTALADVDRQRSSLAWLALRPESAAPIRGLDWVDEIGRPAAKGIDRLIVDSPAAMKMKQVEALLALADLVVLPVLPSVFDEASTARFLVRLERLKPVRKGRIPVLVVANRFRPRARAARRLEAFMEAQGHAATARLADRALYGDVAARGLALFDLPGERARLLRLDWHPLIDAIEALT